jgi:hypothetical protein
MSQKDDPLIVSGYCARRSVHALLRAAARGLQSKEGGRCSVSALINRLVLQHESELRAMALGKAK